MAATPRGWECGTTLHVPQSHDLKFTCLTPECGQHLVVDVSEAGRFLKCPACGKPQRIPGDPPKPIGGELRLSSHEDSARPSTANCRNYIIVQVFQADPL